MGHSPGSISYNLGVKGNYSGIEILFVQTCHGMSLSVKEEMFSLIQLFSLRPCRTGTKSHSKYLAWAQQSLREESIEISSYSSPCSRLRFASSSQTGPICHCEHIRFAECKLREAIPHSFSLCNGQRSSLFIRLYPTPYWSVLNYCYSKLKPRTSLPSWQ